ncbi:MAG: formyltetrahydrofolate deformylase [Lautropia sp.]|nr:formyltetrahydrofolate deformylase [Lautropia sp.]
MSTEYILTLTCPDRPGIVHAVSGLLLDLDSNITEAAQYNDVDSGLFFMRVQFSHTPPTADARATRETLHQALTDLAARFSLQWQLSVAGEKMPTLIMVSRQGHCLNDLLFRAQTGLLPIEVRAIVSNHEDFRPLADAHRIPFHHTPMAGHDKAEVEARQLDIIERSGAQLVVLARYMQILSDEMCRQLQGRAINIHHSFLPSFKGARPYHQAHQRGVKIIGATAHYVTPDLDEGPIIEQDVERVDHAMNAERLTALGGDIESLVLARAVQWHAEHRVLIDGNKTIVFR